MTAPCTPAQCLTLGQFAAWANRQLKEGAITMDSPISCCGAEGLSTRVAGGHVVVDELEYEEEQEG